MAADFISDFTSADVISSTKNIVYELSYELLKELKFRIPGN